MSEENKFIEKIEFLDEYPPFKEWTSIEFWWKKEFQELLSVYWIKKPDRFKLNCIVGGNGAGKSKLLETILKYKSYREVTQDWVTEWHSENPGLWNSEISYLSLDDWSTSFKKDNNQIVQIHNLLDQKIILDDMCGFSRNGNTSINYDFLSKSNYNIWLSRVLNFINTSDVWKKIAWEFCNINNSKFQLKVSYNSDWKSHYGYNANAIQFVGIQNQQEEGIYVNKYLVYEDYTALWKYLFNNLDNENINIIFSLSDLFLWYINKGSDRMMSYNINSSKKVFFSDEWYEDFRDSLTYLGQFLELVENKGLIKKYKDTYMNNERIDHFQKYFLLDITKTDNYFQQLRSNLSKLTNLLDDKSLNHGDETQFWNQNLHNILRKISWYEKSHTNTTDFFILDLFLGFEYSNYNKNEEEIKQAYRYGISFIQEFIWYGVRNPYNIKGINFYKDSVDWKVFPSPFFKLDFEFQDTDGNLLKTISDLSSGELSILLRFSNSFMEMKDNQNEYVILIDEPDLHLHLDWQRQYIQKLVDVFRTLPTDISVHFILATHSPFIVSDLPKECIIKLENWKQVEYEDESFAANYIDLIQDGFFFKNKNLMWSFAEEIVSKLADKERNRVFQWENSDNQLKNIIWDDFLRQNLIYFRKKENEEN